MHAGLSGALALLAAALAGATLAKGADGPPATTSAALEQARAAGDLPFQRRAMWQRLGAIVGGGGAPAFLGWAGKAQAFAAAPDVPGDMTRPSDPSRQMIAELGWRLSHGGVAGADGHPPLLTFVHFNPPAARHVGAQGFARVPVLDALHERAAVQGGRLALPALPADAMVTLSAWWPVAASGATPLPQWDGSGRRPGMGSNSYLGWQRVVAIVPRAETRIAPLAFAGRVIGHPQPVALDRFVRVPVTPALALALAADSEASRLSGIALGRSIRAGDWLVLVGLHLMSAELPGGLWATWWWHDRARDDADSGAGATALPPLWRNYRMDAAFDAVLPRETDGSPRACFNPWLDGGLPAMAAAGGDDGTRSNCASCHARAGWPLVDPALVTRGAPDLARDQAWQPGQVMGAGLWSPLLAAAAAR